MENALIVCVITLSALVVAILILLGILFYNQMLLTNEVNKRLLLMTKESIDKERSTQEELNDALVQLERAANDGQKQPSQPAAAPEDQQEEQFNPHTFMEDHDVV